MSVMWQEDIGWGSGSTMQVAAAAGMRMDLGLNDTTLLQGIMEASSQALRKTHTFDLSEYLGDQGPQGPAGPRGLPGLPGLGTSYVPRVIIPSAPGPGPTPPDHPHSDPDPDDHSWNVLIIWSQIAHAVIMQNRYYDVTGWAKIFNDSGSDNSITLWIMHRTYAQGDPAGLADDGYGPANATRVSDVVTTTVPAGKEVMARVKATFTAPPLSGYVDLYGQLGSYSELLGVEGNHYGISGKGIYKVY